MERWSFATLALSNPPQREPAKASEPVTRGVARGPELSQIFLRTTSHDRLPVARARERRDYGDLPQVMCAANATPTVAVSRAAIRDRGLGSGYLQCWSGTAGAPRERESDADVPNRRSGSELGERAPYLGLDVERIQALTAAPFVARLDELRTSVGWRLVVYQATLEPPRARSKRHLGCLWRGFCLFRAEKPALLRIAWAPSA
jgi:hypothetical protein